MEESLLEVEVAGLKMRNPLILASGILGSYASSLNRISEHAGAVISKSVGVEEVEGYKNPVVVNYSHGIINAVGLSSPGAVKFAEELKAYKGSAPLIVSVFGSSPEEFAKVTSHFPFASAFELNLSCPHSEKYGLTVGSDPDLVKEIVKKVKKATNKPVFAKVSANVDVVEVGKAAEEGGADGIVAINTVKGMRIDIFTKKPILSNISGGVSGSAIKPIAIKCVWDLYEELEIPIIGSGGVTTWRDVVEFMLAGASAVEVGSVMYYSLRAIYSLKESLIAYARMVNCKLEELIGAAHG
ncbi:dihydroorotate dehydrogenase family protein [Ferroglobus placidus DSM 10642]|uniref:Dihydroorotate dehydrogenase n=1 Tax=Ferroglobus placidus (strain DSM 10642 / AEDII12DO) TaxID=589924 RepID=D3S110_FERPA|nr:dihydroorotate dehydrogenase [Ferroglobus placidus]ADC64246.1 dihydroorotate dehydrogenase family protein [Ferroglobus placidus DSM 10642]